MCSKEPFMNNARRFSCLLVAILCIVCLRGQTTNSAYREYVEQYKQMAIDQMMRYRIPASITLAQGLLESGAGRSMLATRANNHFGVKCGGSWTGPYVVRDDDARGEHFRKYDSVAESFEDHSKFLLKPRYASLFTLSMNDYKGWAHGLKRCGYATNPVYAESLITIIENYQLYRFDTLEGMLDVGIRNDNGSSHQSTAVVTTNTSISSVDAFFCQHPVLANNGNYYVLVRRGDTLDGIAKASGVSRKKLLKYNELPNNYEVGEGDIIYFSKKKTKAEKRFKGMCHVVKRGESAYDVAQLYGIRLSRLYRLNGLSLDYAIREGDRLRLR